jgi:hypothetical protein
MGTVTITGTGTLTLAGEGASTSSGTININAPGGTVTLGGDFVLRNAGNDTGTLQVTAGTFNTGANYAVTAPFFNAGGSGTKSLIFNASTLTVGGQQGSAAAIFDSFTVGPNTTVTAGTSSIVLRFGYLRSSGYTYNSITLNNTTNESGIVGGNNTFSTVNIATNSGVAMQNTRFGGGTTTTIGTLVCSGGSIINRNFLQSDTPGTVATLSVTTWSTIANIDFEDITLNSSRSGTNLGNCGGNTNITFAAAKTVYWNLAGTQDISAVGWATTSGGTPALANFPLAQDTLVFNNSGAAGTVNAGTGTNWNFGTINLSARTSAMTLNPSGMYVYGNWSNGSGVTLTGTSPVFFRGRTAATLTSSGRSFGVPLRFNKSATSVTLQDALAITFTGASFYPLSLYSGTFNSNNFNVTLAASTVGGVGALGTISRTFAFGTSLWTIPATGTLAWNVPTSGLSITGSGTISMSGASAKTFAGGGVNYGSVVLNQGGAGTLTLTGANTFSNITNTYSSTGATTITFPASTTTTVSNFTASGTSGNLLTINSSSAGTRATLSKASGTVNVSYLSIQDSAATGGATWNATDSTNAGNNTGWNFLAGSAGNFLLFFM